MASTWPLRRSPAGESRPTRRTGRRGAPAPDHDAEPGPPPGPYVLVLAVVVVLNLVGLMMVLSASSVQALHESGSPWGVFTRQLVWAVLGAAALAVTLRIDYRLWRRLATPLLAVAVVLLVVVLVPGIGREANGARSWLGVGELRFQPSELAKFALLLFAADLLARRARWGGSLRLTLRPVAVVAGLVCGLVLAEPDLGGAIVVGAVALAVLFAAGTPLVPLLAVAGSAAFAALVLALGAGYRRARLLAFLDPMADPLDTGYQTVQSLVGLASGGLTGVGLGASRAKWGFLPHAQTDFIFAIIGEELGLLGAVLVVGLFVVLGVAGLRAAATAPDRFGMLVAAGITAWLLVQALVNMGGVVGLMPVTGLTLPFVSVGGSSLVVSMAAVGVLCNVARQVGRAGEGRTGANRPSPARVRGGRS